MKLNQAITVLKQGFSAVCLWPESPENVLKRGLETHFECSSLSLVADNVLSGMLR